MSNNSDILEAIYEAIDEVNEYAGEEQQLKKDTNTVLYGTESVLDSLGLVNLIAEIEHKVEEKVGKAISLTDEKAMSQKNSPFKTIGTLNDYCTSLI